MNIIKTIIDDIINIHKRNKPLTLIQIIIKFTT